MGSNCAPDPATNGHVTTAGTACCQDGATRPLQASSYDDLLANCPNRSQMPDGSGPGQRLHEVDGCSAGIPGLPSTNIQDPVFGFFNVAGTSTKFGQFQGVPLAPGEAVLPLACNHHDICYQTCGSNKSSCDDTMKSEMDSTCDVAYPDAFCPYSGLEALAKCIIGIPGGGVHANYFTERAWCYSASVIFRQGLGALGGSAYTGRQVDYCRCCN